MMNQYDEYQKHMRYKYDSYAFMLLLVLVFANFALTFFTDFQWADPVGLEYLMLCFIAVAYSVLMYVYRGAYFTKRQNGKLYAGLFFSVGLLNLYTSFSPSSPAIIDDGKLTFNVVMPFAGLLFILISLSYVVKLLSEKRKDQQMDDSKD
ncbi:hypothetical protein ADIAL_0064 [Alkalibacterium sp. AK22]|uniref:hypothetical protein n=1 Tax=Alkalibacterium sp. AK22 TaxID=1229520 RepID=UPI00044C4BDA|nr:hypothetical protein [Alkalibacterium sp. AK22]EXJ24325.1 hypothetical protein ADIAL_0064 [Alkalibacterium sp. AK22]